VLDNHQHHTRFDGAQIVDSFVHCGVRYKLCCCPSGAVAQFEEFDLQQYLFAAKPPPVPKAKGASASNLKVEGCSCTLVLMSTT